MPWFSAKYLGHMNSDILMVANLAYMATILYNPNNVAYEASTATTPMEIEVGKDMATMLGLDPEMSWVISPLTVPLQTMRVCGWHAISNRSRQRSKRYDLTLFRDLMTGSS